MEIDIPVILSNDLEKRIAESFNLFDHIGNKTIDVREVGTILRFLGCAPTEHEINEIISATEFGDIRGTIHLSKFLPHVCQLLTERKMEPASPEKLLQAFEVLDPDGNGYLTKDYFAKLIMEEGEPFTQEELDEMMAVAVDPQTGTIAYEYYINQLMFEAKDSVYELAARVEAQRIANIPQPKTMADFLKQLS